MLNKNVRGGMYLEWSGKLEKFLQKETVNIGPLPCWPGGAMPLPKSIETNFPNKFN